MVRINDVIESLQSYYPHADTALIEKAYIFSARAHQGQIRLSGEPYLTHPLQVAYILTKMKMDDLCVVTGILHDTMEDTSTSLEEIQELFGPHVASLVDGLTKISKINFSSAEEQQAENFRKMILAMAQDLRVILIKLADRIHNMRTLEFLSSEKQRAIAQETLDIYSSIANRLGIDWIKTELEDLSFKFLHPKEFYYLDDLIRSKKEERNQYVQKVKKIISEKLEQFNIRHEVVGRLKHYYSIYQKMLRQQIDFDQVYDLIAFRIIVDSIKDCYAALGIIHSLWTPVPGRFKDFIAMPKANMYQSLHTTVIGPYGERMEIQIRTVEMHKIAEEGIAAHWRYKESGKEIDKEYNQLFSWLRQMLEWQQELKDPGEFLETFRIDLFPQEVYVFTPRGEVKSFPKGATPIDFAYAIHTNVGHQCIGARANGRMVPLAYELRNGDTIEIITSKNQKPGKDWLNIVKTSHARTKIRQWIRLTERDDDIQAGRDACEREFKRNNLNFNRLLKFGKVGKAIEELGFNSVQEFFIAITQGKIQVSQVIQKLIPTEELEKRVKSFTEKIEKRPKAPDYSSVVQVKGVDQVLVSFAKCCNPLPGDKIVGYITKGRGVTIHLDDCPRLLETIKERRVEVSWNQNNEVTRTIKLRVLSQDKPGLLAEISGAITKLKSNIKGAKVITTGMHQGVSTFELEVKDLAHLESIIKHIKKIKGVMEVNRIKL
ncbi:MAG TPA: bifunctional (p)ppGpp synthetase/guanosine-3',5'-bis(diphosphate) 3'-pyrophosphohydrolase [Thermodesulfobacteriota bacterium]|nr:bifunctional (p)ppGpp synthetase/guanosine-3',5'-bis(diphosphate) 3'-pyrophosphohydrolase [Thermodesulfobacteriota bacterium]